MHAQAETQQRAELRLAFLRHLPKRAEAIGRRGRRFCRDGWDINGLSLLYEDFAPRPGRPLDDEEKQLLTTLSGMQGYLYEPVNSICRLPNPSVPSEDFEPERYPRGLSDPLAAYFAAMNTGANQGDRLASLTRLTMSNLNSVGRKFVMGDFARQIG